MQIKKISHQLNYYLNNIYSKSNRESNFITNEKEDEKIGDPSVWNELSQKYDITNASFDELHTISKKLYEARQISLFEHGLLTFNPTKSPQWKIISKGYQNAKYYLTDTDNQGNRDWIAEFKARIERAKKMGNLLGIENMNKVLNILERLKKE